MLLLRARVCCVWKMFSNLALQRIFDGTQSRAAKVQISRQQSEDNSVDIGMLQFSEQNIYEGNVRF